MEKDFLILLVVDLIITVVFYMLVPIIIRLSENKKKIYQKGTISTSFNKFINSLFSVFCNLFNYR